MEKIDTLLKEEKRFVLQGLKDKFEENLKQYHSELYDEANTRVDFIDKLFEFLDWDVRNDNGYAEQYREVVREDKVRIQGVQKAPDYSFRLAGVRKFFVEAKKPAVRVKTASEPAFQVRPHAKRQNKKKLIYSSTFHAINFHSVSKTIFPTYKIYNLPYKTTFFNFERQLKTLWMMTYRNNSTHLKIIFF